MILTTFECILEKGIIAEIYNIGCDEHLEYSVLEIAKILIKLIKNTENYDEWIEYIDEWIEYIDEWIEYIDEWIEYIDE